MALDKRYMLTLTGVGKECVDNLKYEASNLSICPPSVVEKFNITHKQPQPQTRLHGELALRMYPYLKEAYWNTVGLLSTARSYLRNADVGMDFPGAGDLRGLTDIGKAATAVADAVNAVKRKDRVTEEHTAMKIAMDRAALSYSPLATVCAQALRY